MGKFRLLTVAMAVAASVAPAGAAEQSPAVTSAAGQSKSVVVTGTRQEILERAFAESGVTVDWSDRKFADEMVEIDTDASADDLIGRLLSRANFIVAYEMEGGKQRVTRVIVLGPGSALSSAAELHTRIAAQRRQQTRRAASQVDEETRERLEQVRIKMLKRRQDLAAAVGERSTALGGNAPLLRTQVLSRVPLTGTSSQAGNIPVVSGPGHRR